MIEYRITATHELQPTILAAPNPDPGFIGQLYEALAVMTNFADLTIQYREVDNWQNLPDEPPLTTWDTDNDSDVRQ
jgi:hypothetical protein